MDCFVDGYEVIQREREREKGDGDDDEGEWRSAKDAVHGGVAEKRSWPDACCLIDD